MSFYISWIFAPIIKVGDYYVNLQEYKENCVNKDKIDIVCNGKCQLNKSLNDNETEKPALNLFPYDFSIAFISNSIIYIYFIPSQFKINNFNYNTFYKFKYLSYLFKPPIQ